MLFMVQSYQSHPYKDETARNALEKKKKLGGGAERLYLIFINKMMII
tara:strand:+ start:147 stop:287 length:141 start_codon:yes stop_codon:yes gene_type:complete